MKTQILEISSGNFLEVVTQGEVSSRAFVVHHGGFGCAEGMAPIYRASESSGIFVIGITRGGYAASTRREGRYAGDYVKETKFALDYFGVREFVSFGWSSGGLAVISDLQDLRCKGGITIASDAEIANPEWPRYLERYPANNWKTIPFPNIDISNFANVSAEEFEAALSIVLSEPDHLMMQGKFGEELAAGVRHGMKAGPYGIMDDSLANESEWRIDYSTINLPVAIYQGIEDRICTPAHGHFLADKLQKSELKLFQNQGHLSLIYDLAQDMVEQGFKYFRN